MMLEILTPKKGKVKAVHYDMSDKVFDPELERLGRFFVDRMPEGECTFEAFIANPSWAFSIYGRSGKSFDKAIVAG